MKWKNKKRGSWQRTETAPVLPITGKKSSDFLKVIWKYRGILNSLFIYFSFFHDFSRNS